MRIDNPISRLIVELILICPTALKQRAHWLDVKGNAMPNTREEILEERRRLKTEFGQLFDSIAALLFQHDPVGINFHSNTDEYEPEVRTILPRLRTCHSADDVRKVVHEEFVRWFDAGTAGSQERYATIASEIWELWQKANLI